MPASLGDHRRLGKIGPPNNHIGSEGVRRMPARNRLCAWTLEIEQRSRDNVAELEARYRLPREVAQRIVEMSASIDQAYALAELMR